MRIRLTSLSFAGLVIALLLTLACQMSNRQGETAAKLSEQIRVNCPTAVSCQVKAADMTEFVWDRLYVFESRVEDDVISREVGTLFSDRGPYYSNKWFFLKDGQIVHSEQKVITDEDRPMNDGDVDIEASGPQSDFNVFRPGDVFDVERIKTDPGEAYRLRCSNCNLNQPGQ